MSVTERIQKRQFFCLPSSQDRLSLNACQKYCRMLQESILHSAILSTFIKLPFVFKTFVLSIFERPLKTGFSICMGK